MCTNTSTDTHMLLAPDVWNSVTLQRGHKSSLTLRSYRNQNSLFCLICPIRWRLRETWVSGSLIGRAWEASGSGWTNNVVQREKHPWVKGSTHSWWWSFRNKLTSAPLKRLERPFCPPSQIKQYKKKKQWWSSNRGGRVSLYCRSFSKKAFDQWCKPAEIR